MKSSRPVKRTRREKGGTIVESTLVMLTVVGMIVFVMDMGRLLMTQQYISERARTTARQAALNNWDSTTTANMLVYGTSEGTRSNGAYVGGYAGLVPSQVSYTTLGTQGTPDYRLQIKVSGVPMFTWIPWISGQYTAPPVVVTAPAQNLGSTD